MSHYSWHGTWFESRCCICKFSRKSSFFLQTSWTLAISLVSMYRRNCSNMDIKSVMEESVILVGKICVSVGIVGWVSPIVDQGVRWPKGFCACCLCIRRSPKLITVVGMKSINNVIQSDSWAQSTICSEICSDIIRFGSVSTLDILSMFPNGISDILTSV